MTDFVMYEGFLVDEPVDSKVNGMIIDGSFVGSIRSKRSGEYFVEPGVRFDKSLGLSQSVVYHESDIDTDFEHLLAPKKKRDVDESSDEKPPRGISCGAAKEYVNDILQEKQEQAVNNLHL